MDEKKLNTGIDYKNRKYRPNVFMDKSREPVVLDRVGELGYRSANEYICALIEYDIEHDVCPGKND